MSANDLARFLKTPWGKRAGLSADKAQKLGIKRGTDSAKAIIRMKQKGVKKWNESDWKWCQRQVSFIKRTLGQKHKFFKDKLDKNGDLVPTRYLLALLVWGHNPFKN